MLIDVSVGYIPCVTNVGSSNIIDIIIYLFIHIFPFPIIEVCSIKIKTRMYFTLKWNNMKSRAGRMFPKFCF